MSAVAGIAGSFSRSEFSPLLCAMLPENAAERSSFSAAENAGFRALAPGRTAASADGTMLVALTGSITNCTLLCRERDLPEDETALLFSLCMEDSPERWNVLEGSFSFALWDGVHNRLTLAADRLGAHPLCWCRTKGGIAFATSAGALNTLTDHSREYDLTALRYYFSMQYLPPGRSVYAGVGKLLPGTVLTFSDPARTAPPQTGSLGSLGTSLAAIREGFSCKDAAVRLRKLLSDSVARAVRCVPDDRPAGVLLSGGIDSTILAGLAAEAADARGIHTFTIGTDDPRYDERAAAKLTVEAIRRRGGTVTHHEFSFGAEDLDRLRKRTLLWGEPYADSSLLPAAKLWDEASQYTGLLLGGDGGDELFCGYDRYRAMELSAKLDGWGAWLRPLFRMGAQCLPDRGDRSVSGRLRRFGTFLGEGDVSRRYLALWDRCPGSAANFLLGERFRKTPGPAANLGEWTSADHDLPPAELAARWDLANYLPGDTCIKSVIAGMGTGASFLTPMLEREIIAFAQSLPLAYKRQGREGKRILKTAFPDLIPPELLHLPKRGFGAPVAAFLRGPWKHCAETVLFDSPLVPGGWLRREGLERLWHEHCAGTRDHSYFLWGAMVLAWFLEAEQRN